MTFFSILATLLIGPLKLVFEVIFNYANQLTGHSGVAIIFLSLIINILIMPLYRRADAMQKEIRDKEAALNDGVVHIKKTFHGDERMMILQTYYRQNHYKPTDALKGSVSLLLEIPFFIAAYQFLSHLEILKGVSMGPIKDLAASDGLLVIGGMTINLLPIIMTVINVISSAVYLRGFPLKTKIQLYAMALFFLVFLYSSPSALVLYWTMNNVFSLFKNIFYKPDRPQKLLRFILYANYVLFLAYESSVSYPNSYVKREFWIIGGILILLVPLYLKEKMKFQEKEDDMRYNHRLFFLASIYLTVLVGLLIPSVFIAASPQEYVYITYYYNPLWYIISALCLSAGTFLVWMRVFYWLATPKDKAFISRIVWIICGVTLINYMFFGTNLGVISASLKYENGLSYSMWQQTFNLLILVVVAVLMYFCVRKWKRFATTVLIISIITLGIMTSSNLFNIKKSLDQINSEKYVTDVPHFQLSKTGQNVVVLLLDRAMGEYIPYIFNEKPELKEQFAGFTYYENTISFGGHTNFGVPALMGGYEYTPVEINKRNNESLVSKHNEALKVMPVIFLENGFDVTICDAPYANYQWIPDLSIYDDYPEMKTYITKGQFSDENQIQTSIENNNRNFFCFSMMKTMPLFMQPIIYNDGRYHQIYANSDNEKPIVDSMSVSSGLSYEFLESYYVLTNLSNMTTILEEEENTFCFLYNDATHSSMILQEPEYTPAMNVDNTIYDIEHADRFKVDGRELKVEDSYSMANYQCHMAVLIQLGKWFDYLRENNLYDNTKIILVSDHGNDLGQCEELLFSDSNGNKKDAESYYPLLMVKDFDSQNFVTSDMFMTNADVPTLAMENIIQTPTNPFTGKLIDNNEKNAHDQFIIISGEVDIVTNNGNTFLPAEWASVRESIWNEDNWTFYNQEIVLDEHVAP